MSSFEYIRPNELNNSRILSWFSYKNPDYRNNGSKINGLNLGFSSNETQEHILKNIHELTQDLEIERKNLALATQIHGSEVAVVKSGGVYDGFDGFVTNSPEIVLGIQVADCAAILFGDFEHKVIGAAHAGWRGAVNNVASNTVEKMLELGASPSTIQVFVSPCLAKHNFEVGEEVAAQFASIYVDSESYSKPHVDLSGFLKNQLMELGLNSSNIEIDGRCTIDHSELFYSYRREKDNSGRMLAMIKLNKV